MNKYKRIFVIVLDSLGIGAMPDSPGLGTMAWIRSDIFWRKWERSRFRI